MLPHTDSNRSPHQRRALLLNPLSITFPHILTHSKPHPHSNPLTNAGHSSSALSASLCSSADRDDRGAKGTPWYTHLLKSKLHEARKCRLPGSQRKKRGGEPSRGWAGS